MTSHQSIGFLGVVLATALLVTLGFAFGAEPASNSRALAAQHPNRLSLSPVYRLKAVEGRQLFVTRSERGFENLPVEGIAFYAVTTNEWPAGLVGVFAVEHPKRFELRRRSPRGDENSVEPLFFALPPEDEPDAAKIAGRWQCQAIRGNGSKAYLGWDLNIEAGRLSGRFDPSSEYRVAYLAGGLFQSNHIELRVEYINDVYLLVGEWRAGQLKGMWRQSDDSEHGVWEAARVVHELPAGEETAALFEWRRDEGRRYALEGEEMGVGWERAARPLCRVWRAAEKNRP
jgi:hypothetical protein